MKSSKYLQIKFPRGAMSSICSLGVAVALGICGAAGSTVAHAQATSGSIFGWAPVGETVTIQSATGLRRHATVNPRGRYNLGSLPMGTYAVTLEKDGQAVETHPNVKLIVGMGKQVDFTCGGVKCAQMSSN